MMTSIRLSNWTYYGLAACAVFSLASMAYRFSAERSNRAVALAAEADTLEALGLAEGKTLPRALKDLSDKGFNALVLTEETVGELAVAGQLKIVTTPDSLFVSGDKFALKRVVRAVMLRLPGSKLKIDAQGKVSMLKLSRNISPSYLKALPVGLNPIQAKHARNAKWTIIARCSNQPGATERTVRGTVAWARELGAVVFLPTGDQVLGQRNNLQALIDELKQRKMVFANPEFAKIGGLEAAARLAPGNMVRLHAAQAAELDKYTEKEYLERFDLAASERGIRTLLLRPLSLSGKQPLQEFGRLAYKLAKQLNAEGLSVGKPRPFRNAQVPVVWFLFIGASLAFTVFTVIRPWLASDRARYIAIAALALAAASCAFDRAREYVALLAAVIAPLLAFAYLEQANDRPIVKHFALMSLISLVGGLCVAGLLNGVAYYTRTDQFTGVKAAHLLPVAVVGLYFFVQYADGRGVLKTPVFWGQAIVAFGLLAVFAFMLVRTGNDSPGGVSGIELKLRSLLAHLLQVRPRSKEIFVGHPILFVAIGMLLRYKLLNPSDRSRSGWLALALMVGAIGQTSIVNTMCHLHTPLTVSAVRIFIGWLIGGAAGYVLWNLFKDWILPIHATAAQGVLFDDWRQGNKEGTTGG